MLYDRCIRPVWRHAVFVQRLFSFDTPDRLQDAASAIAWSSSTKDPQRLASMATAFATQQTKELYACVDNGRIVGLVALDQVFSPTVTICQVGVHPSRRGQGIGRRMIQHVAAVHAVGALQAETDCDAVGFYRLLGFDVQSLGEEYPGIERFLCTLAPLQKRSTPRDSDGRRHAEEGHGEVRIRAVAAVDLSQIAELYVSVFSAPPWNEQHSVENAAKSMAAIIDDPSFCGMLATVGDRVVGAALGCRAEGSSAGRFSFRELFVDVALQRRGIGTALVEDLEQQLREADVTRVSLMTAADSSAHVFYVAQGYRDISRRVILEKNLGDPDSSVSR